ncbi:hypothetical protein Slala04_66060 [Streptomyces lavendulae subsp. lavendulae]|nr:hypothetical protein Slala04_66060 [Streptomyces lavendulae subsp. lavendulae]
MQIRHLLEQPVGRSDVHEVDSAFEADPGNPRIIRLDAQHNGAHITQLVQHLPETGQVADIHAYPAEPPRLHFVPSRRDDAAGKPPGERAGHRRTHGSVSADDENPSCGT